MTNTYCDSCARWTDPATLQDGDCPGCVAVRPDKAEQALAVMEQKWRNPMLADDCPLSAAEDYYHAHTLDNEPPITPEYLRERGFVEPE